jgi:TPR repeat protein
MPRVIALLLATQFSCAFVADDDRDLVDAYVLYAKRDLGAAFDAMRSLAEKGEAHAQFRLGLMYGLGEGTTRNDAEAVAWLRRSAEQNVVEAQYQVGLRYAEGLGIAKDLDLAMAWLKRSAAADFAAAKTAIGELYLGRHGFPADHRQALVWLEAGAEADHAPAMSELGQMYLHGRGVGKDVFVAYQWLSMAAARHEPGQERDDAVRAGLTARAELTPALVGFADKHVATCLEKADYHARRWGYHASWSE